MFPIGYVLIGLMFIFEPESFKSKGGPPPAVAGWCLVIFSGMFTIAGWVFAGLVITAGRFLALHKHHLFCLVIAAAECVFIPFGTVLGVFTHIVLMRESVKELFSESATVGERG